ncbi:hypothetical protein CYMTET_47404 [Cymbomonas tetramitiformis]|uniref:OTU domain-containing protein n=1 Tax=Cymbomonas tetramitiformis TaxID=36881 RepID=A0AAE0EW15_9CHLO|nr:hypothetical protein CYMTET_47404 [Cymbomonas tetramitiformis]
MEDEETDTGAKMETVGQMNQRHKREVKAMKAAQAKLGKKKKDEAAALEAALKARHEKELTELEAAGSEDPATGAAEEMANPSSKPQAEEVSLALDACILEGEAAAAPTQKISKAQKKKMEKARKEAEREERIKAEKAELGESDRDREEKALKMKLMPQGMLVREIKADGHCLYRSVEDQLSLAAAATGAAYPDYLALRGLAAQHMQDHAGDFLPFVEGCDGEDAEERYAAYCGAVRSSSEWGGQLELQALAHSLQRCIRVTSAHMPLVELGSEYMTETSEALNVAYLLHSFGLGEHYNSVGKIKSPQ